MLAGHVDSRTGPAVFYKLHELKAGDRIEVQRGGAWLTFKVTAREHYAKEKFPSAKVYGPTPLPELDSSRAAATSTPPPLLPRQRRGLRGAELAGAEQSGAVVSWQ